MNRHISVELNTQKDPQKELFMAYENLIARALGQTLKNPIVDVLKMVKLPTLLRGSEGQRGSARVRGQVITDNTLEALAH